MKTITPTPTDRLRLRALETSMTFFKGTSVKVHIDGIPENVLKEEGYMDVSEIAEKEGQWIKVLEMSGEEIVRAITVSAFPF